MLYLIYEFFFFIASPFLEDLVMTGLLNGVVRLVMLQFSFSNIKAMPSGIQGKPKKNFDRLTPNRTRVEGVEFLTPTENVSLRPFLSDLVAMGYVLVDAFYEMRSNPRGKEYPVVRFTFAEKETARFDSEFAEHRGPAICALRQMCEEAMWRPQGYLNPFFKDGEPVEGEHAIAINLVARNPLIDGNGKRVVRWERDSRGDRIGDAPILLEPELFLMIEDGDVCVVPD